MPEITIKDVCPQRRWPDGRRMCSEDKVWACRTLLGHWARELFIKYDGKTGEQHSYTIEMASCGQKFTYHKKDFINDATKEPPVSFNPCLNV